MSQQDEVFGDLPDQGFCGARGAPSRCAQHLAGVLGLTLLVISSTSSQLTQLGATIQTAIFDPKH